MNPPSQKSLNNRPPDHYRGLNGNFLRTILDTSQDQIEELLLWLFLRVLRRTHCNCIGRRAYGLCKCCLLFHQYLLSPKQKVDSYRCPKEKDRPACTERSCTTIVLEPLISNWNQPHSGIPSVVSTPRPQRTSEEPYVTLQTSRNFDDTKRKRHPISGTAPRDTQIDFFGQYLQCLVLSTIDFDFLELRICTKLETMLLSNIPVVSRSRLCLYDNTIFIY